MGSVIQRGSSIKSNITRTEKRIGLYTFINITLQFFGLGLIKIRGNLVETIVGLALADADVVPVAKMRTGETNSQCKHCLLYTSPSPRD